MSSEEYENMSNDPPGDLNIALALIMDRFDRVDDRLDRHSRKLDDLSTRLQELEYRLRNAIPISKYKVKIAMWTIGISGSFILLFLKLVGGL